MPQARRGGIIAAMSIHLGNLVGYEKGENIVPVFLEANTLVTEHLAVLAMTGSGKSYTVGRIIAPPCPTSVLVRRMDMLGCLGISRPVSLACDR